jgi:glutaredoxin
MRGQLGSTICSIWADDTTNACERAASKRKAMPRRISVVGPSRLVAAAVGVVLLSLASAPAEAGCSKGVTMYNAYWCPYCKQVRAILARNHIRYSIRDATTERVQVAMIRKFGDTAVPRTVIGGDVVEGVDEARIKQLCR